MCQQISEIICEIFVAACFGIAAEWCIFCFRIEEFLTSGRKAEQCPFYKMPELMQDCPRFRNINGSLLIAGDAGSGHIIQLAHFRRILMVDNELPSVLIERIEDGIRKIAQFHKIIVEIRVRAIFAHDRRFRRFDRKLMCQCLI